MSPTPHTTFRLSGEARMMLSALAAHMGLTQTAILEWLIRERYRRDKPAKPKKKA